MDHLAHPKALHHSLGAVQSPANGRGPTLQALNELARSAQMTAAAPNSGKRFGSESDSLKSKARSARAMDTTERSNGGWTPPRGEGGGSGRASLRGTMRLLASECAV